MERLERMPVPVLPTFVGALTLSNVYSGMGYVWIRHLTMWTATVVLLLYIIKIIKYPKTCLSEYQTVVPCSLYAGFTMVMMILGSYYFGIWKGTLEYWPCSACRTYSRIYISKCNKGEEH